MTRPSYSWVNTISLGPAKSSDYTEFINNEIVAKGQVKMLSKWPAIAQSGLEHKGQQQ